MRLENGFGSIHNIDGKKVKGKRRKPFRARVSLSLDEFGKRKYHTVGYFKTEREAYEALLEYHKNSDTSKKEITVAEIYNNLLNTSLSNLSENRLTMIKSYYNALELLHNKKISDIKLNDIETLLYGKTKNTQKEYLTLLSKIFEWAIKNEYATKNYAKYIKAGEVKMAETKKQNSTNMDLNEVNHFIELETQGVKYADAIKILLFSGMRINELLKLKRDNVFLEEGYMIGGLKTENGRNRIIPIHNEIKPIIEKWMVDNNSKKLINISSYSNDNILKFIKKHFPHHKTHNTRHTFTSRMIKLGVSEQIIKAIVGHDNGDVTQIYTHIDKEDLIEAINKLHYNN